MKMFQRFGHTTRLVLILFASAAGSIVFSRCDKDDDDVDDTRVDFKEIATGMVSPLGVVAPTDNTGRLFVIDQIGKIWIIDNAGNTMATPFLDVSGMMV